MKIFKSVLLFAKRNAPTILAVGGSVGCAVTAYLSAKAGAEINENAGRYSEDQIKDREIRKQFLKESVISSAPAVISLAATVVCIMGSNSLNKKRQAGLVAAYCMLEQSYKNYISKVDPETHEKIVKEIEVETIENAISKSDDILENDEDNDGKCLWHVKGYPELFRETELNVVKSEYALNRLYALKGYATLQDFYDILGLKKVKGANELMWCYDFGIDDGYEFIDFVNDDYYVNDDGLTVRTIQLPFEPRLDEWEVFGPSDFDELESSLKKHPLK